MKALSIKYKAVIRFILVFLLVYGVLTFVYKLYLDYSSHAMSQPDFITRLVAQQTDTLLQAFGYDSHVIRHPNEPSMQLIINGKYVARVIEGCNSVSIIILFVSFVIAFADDFKSTFIYILAGSVLVYIVNLLRIVILSVGLYHYPWRQDELHTVVFPLIIYGMVFLLWLVWVNRFSKLKTTDE